MTVIVKFISIVLSVIYLTTGINLFESKQSADNFRITAYVVGSGFVNANAIDDSHFSQITDAIFFGMASFNEDGEIILDKNFDVALGNLRNAIGENDVKVHVNLLGPGSDGGIDDWNEQMKSLSRKHDNAFKSGKLEDNIKVLLEKYKFDGVFFDYEYPAEKKNWKTFDEFLVRLDKVIGNEHTLGAAISGWNSKQTKKGRDVLDVVEVMAYDLFEKDGTHASMRMSKQAVRQMLLLGYEPKKLDFGCPFYARPTNQGAYWYGYNGWSDKIDSKGFAYDENVGLTFSFNTYDTIYKKTTTAIKAGLGGVMVWHYSCDIPASNDDSLFNAMYNAKTANIK